MHSAHSFGFQRFRADEAALLGDTCLILLLVDNDDCPLGCSGSLHPIVTSLRESQELCVYDRMGLACKINNLVWLRPYAVQFCAGSGIC